MKQSSTQVLFFYHDITKLWVRIKIRGLSVTLTNSIRWTLPVDSPEYASTVTISSRERTNIVRLHPPKCNCTLFYSVDACRKGTRDDGDRTAGRNLHAWMFEQSGNLPCSWKGSETENWARTVIIGRVVERKRPARKAGSCLGYQRILCVVVRLLDIKWFSGGVLVSCAIKMYGIMQQLSRT